MFHYFQSGSLIRTTLLLLTIIIIMDWTPTGVYIEREKRVYLQLHELDYNHTKCEIQNTG